MAYAYRKGSRGYLGWKDAAGRPHRAASNATTRADARRMADDLERRAERQRMGLEALPLPDGGGTLDGLLEWWLATYSAHSASHIQNGYTLRRHIIGTDLGHLRLVDLSPGRIEEFLQAKMADLAPQSVNHLRRFMLSAFNCAKRAGRWSGTNPVAEVRRRKLARRSVADYLRSEEVPLVLDALHPRWRPLFAAAVFTGLRKSELRALRKRDVDLGKRLLTVARSGERETTKGGHADVIPIAAELVPFLEQALEGSPSELVFPHVCATSCAYQTGCPGPGGMMRPDVALESVLRRAMGRAGLVTAYIHVCRRLKCNHREAAADGGLRSCPKCRMKLWPKPLVRPIRFHDLRHTTASLLMQAGAPIHAVQRILRHRDPRMTANVYGHLAPDYLLGEVDRLRFGLGPPPSGSCRLGVGENED